MMLDPLAQVRIRVLMAVVIGGRQLVMHLKSRRKRSQCQESRAQDEREDREDTDRGSSVREKLMHTRGFCTRAPDRKSSTPLKTCTFGLISLGCAPFSCTLAGVSAQSYSECRWSSSQYA